MRLSVKLHRRAVSRRPGEAAVGGDEWRVEGFGQGHVGSVVSGQVVAQVPNPRPERGMRVAFQARGAEPAQGQVCSFRREDTAEVVASQNLEHLDLEEMRYV